MRRSGMRARFAIGIAPFILISSAAQAQVIYSQSGGPDVFASAVNWLSGTLLGTVATAAAVMAVAAVGIVMLTGRMDVRRSVQVILGCFIIFGAATLANGIIAAVSLSSGGSDQNPPVEQVVSAPAPTVPVNSVRAVSDPYAGAAVPQR